MKRALLLASLSIPIILNSSEPLISAVLICTFGVILLRHNSWILIVMVLSLSFEWDISTLLPLSSKSIIVELNDKSVIASTPKGKVMIYIENSAHYNLLDEIHIKAIQPFKITPTSFGFDSLTYYKTNHWIGTCDEEDLEFHHPNILMNFIGLGGLNADPVFHKMSRALLFQSDPESSFISIISLGLIYTMILKLLSHLLSFVLDERLANGLVIMGLLTMAYQFAYPLSLIRVIVSYLLTFGFKDKGNRLMGYVFFFVLYNMSSLKSPVILYPFLFQCFGTFGIKSVKRYSSLAILQISLFHSTSFALIVMYPLLRKWMSAMILLIWLGYLLPFMNPLIIHMYNFYQWALEHPQSLMIIRGSMSMGVTLMLLVIAMIMYIKHITSGLLLACSLCLIPILSVPWFYQVTFISVGQGDAILLQAPFNQEVILIDTGKENAYGQLSSFPNAQGINRLTVLITTHDDLDHSGNVENLSENYEIMRRVIHPEDVDLTWFHLKSLKTRLKEPDDNQASLMYLFQIKQIKFLMMADTDERTELDLIQQVPNLKADILKVGHHGSASSTSDLLLSHIQARLAIISVGYNTYGHPSYLTLNRLSAFHIPVWTTKTPGDITFIMAPQFDVLWTSSLKHRVLRLGV